MYILFPFLVSESLVHVAEVSFAQSRNDIRKKRTVPAKKPVTQRSENFPFSITTADFRVCRGLVSRLLLLVDWRRLPAADPVAREGSEERLLHRANRRLA